MHNRLDPNPFFGLPEVGFAAHLERVEQVIEPEVPEDCEGLDRLLIGEDVGIDGAAASAEEAAMHVIERLPEDSDSE